MVQLMATPDGKNILPNKGNGVKPPTWYQRQIMADSGCSLDEARRIEGFMRIEYGTLDHIYGQQWKREVAMGMDAVRLDPAEWESCAQSFGL
jgi:hypothetical protein